MKKAISYCPEEPAFYFSLGNSYSQNKQYLEAIDNLNKAKEFGYEPKPSLHYNLGNNYAQLKKYDEAIENYKETLRHDKKHFNAWQNLIITYYKKGDKNNAIKLANELAKIDDKGEYGAWAKEAIRQMK